MWMLDGAAQLSAAATGQPSTRGGITRRRVRPGIGDGEQAGFGVVIEDAVVLLSQAETGKPEKYLQAVLHSAPARLPLQPAEFCDRRLGLTVEQQFVGQIEAGLEELRPDAGVQRVDGLAQARHFIAEMPNPHVVGVRMGERLDALGDLDQPPRHAPGAFGPVVGRRFPAGRVGEKKGCCQQK